MSKDRAAITAGGWTPGWHSGPSIANGLHCLKVSLLLLPFLLAGGCTSSYEPREKALEATASYTQPVFSAERVLSEDVVDPLAIADPWHRSNRFLYGFNARLDRVALNPLVAGYRRILPRFAREGVTNFFDNLDMIRTTVNLALQGRPVATGRAAGRLLTNSTLGLAGLFDVASRLNIPTYEEDFGQTLGRYGVAQGPYLVLPLFGPSNLRDAFGRAVDAAFLGFLDPLELNGNAARGFVYYPLLVVDTRATTAFQYFESGSPFEYELVRKLFATKRDIDVEK